MTLQVLSCLSRAACIAGAILLAPAAASAQQPSAGAIATASEIIDLRGTTALFAPLVPGVIEQAKNVLLQTNIMLSKDLNEVAENLRKELTPRTNELRAGAARIYAARFTEQELKDLLVFYKSPLGRKTIAEEPVAINDTMQMAQDWANRLSEDVLGRFRAEMKKRGHNL